MADKTYTQAEHDAIVAAAVERETASLQDKIAELEAKNDEQASRLEVVEAEKAAAETKATKAETDLAEYRDEVESEKAAKARRDSREQAMREVAKALGDDWFTDERKDRWARMSDEDFDAQKAEIAEIASKVGDGGNGSPSPKPLPKETAMEGTRQEESAQGSHKAATVLGLRRGRKVS